MKNLKKNRAIPQRPEAGFGYCELLVVISIIGVLSGIAIPALSGVFGKADSAKAERNAQSLVATFNAARAAGNSMSFADRGEAISALTTPPGINGSGAYAGSQFYVPMAPVEITEATARIAPSLVGSPTEGSLTIAP